MKVPAKELSFDTGVYTEITQLATGVNPAYQNNGYSRMFIWSDVKNIWLVRFLPGKDEDYEYSSGVLVERENIDSLLKCEELTVDRVVNILKDDFLECWDTNHFLSENDAIAGIADMYGILNVSCNKITTTRDTHNGILKNDNFRFGGKTYRMTDNLRYNQITARVAENGSRLIGDEILFQFILK